MRVRPHGQHGAFFVASLVMLIGSVAAASCVFPPSFSDYEAQAGGTAGQGAAGTGGASSGGASTGGSQAGGAGGAAQGGAPIGGAPQGGFGGGPGDFGGWGQRCAEMGMCDPGLTCLPVVMDISSYASAAGIHAPMCVSDCIGLNTNCVGPGGNDGICLKDGACVPYCDAQFGPGCREGSMCFNEFSFEGIGVCTPLCWNNMDCAWLGYSRCRGDGICDNGEIPQDPTNCNGKACECYPDNGSIFGTCKLFCQRDSDCPMHLATGRQMFCPQDDTFDPAAFSFCVVPCDTTADCDAVGGSLICEADFDGRKACDLPF